MDGQQTWTDFHFLNSAFRDITDTRTNRWIDSSLVRLSYRGSRERSATGTVKALDGLSVEYAAPFPLTYIFGPKTIQVYGSILVFMLQIRRAQSVLDRILVKGVVSVDHDAGDLKLFYAMRSKLSWFVK